eukprot:Transcript_8235.p1 GENE.Transcript_8235~~Transcript_8235.p1  ORF type:complete len:504 (+),score=208.49 Transcript_8235:80-1591(+)
MTLFCRSRTAAASACRRRFSSGSRTIEVISPRDGKPFATLQDWSAADVDAAVTRGRSHLASSWASRGAVDGRCDVLRRMGAALRERLEEFSQLETLDCGKPIVESRVDIETCAALFDYYAELAPGVLLDEPLAVPDDAFASRVVPHPVGLVGAVTPWNYPLMQAVVKVAPALATGCAVLLKPSPLASLTCEKLGELGADAGLPEGALAVVTGGPPGGAADGAAALVQHPQLDYLSFTGSGATGRALLHASAEALRPTALELGGKGAMIVFDDAELAAVVDWAMVGIFSCTGQVCSATSRLLVHKPLYEELVARLVEGARKVRTGDPLLEETQMGPIVSAAQKAKVLAAVDAAVAGGAEVLLGGGEAPVAGLEGGYYVQPSLLLDRAPRLGGVAWRDEIFGPVLTIATFETEDEAVELANDSPYGLGHAVMSADAARCERVGARLEAGTVWLNCSQAMWPSTPFGGWKQSGFGREWGAAGMREYLKHKTVTSAPPGYSWGAYGA